MSSLTKGLILLAVILGIGAGLVAWKQNAGAGGTFSSITKQEVELLLADAAKSNPMALKRFKEDEKARKDQLEQLKELLAFASQAYKEGMANESPNKEELRNIRNEVVAVTYDREINKDKGPMPPFGFITEDQINAFWGQGEQPQKSWFENLKDKVGLGAKDREVEFKKFLDSKVAILKRDNPQMADRQISEEETKQAREFFAKIGIYNDEYARKVRTGELPKEFQEKVELQAKLQQAQFLARLYAEKVPEKVKPTEAEITKYIADHPELDPAAKKAKAEEVLNRVKAGEDFAALAKEFSDDPGSKDKGGQYENVRLGQMVKPFEDAAMSVQPGEVVPSLVETDFGYHIIKLESKKAAPAEPEGEDAEPGAAPAGGEVYSVRHILISTGVKDAENPNPMARETPVKKYVEQKLQEEKQKKLIEEIVAKNHVTVPEDFDVPEVSEEQINEIMKQRQQQMQVPEGLEEDEAPPAARGNTNSANASKPAAKPAPKKNN